MTIRSMLRSLPPRPTWTVLCVTCLVWALLQASAASADLVRAVPAGRALRDTRLGPLKDLDGYFPFVPPRSPEEWSERADKVRRRMLVALGLWPLPTRTPLEPVVHGRIEMDGYTVEKVYFQSMPGFYVTGNLFRPQGGTPPYPAVLCPHGHWSNGRFHDAGRESVRQQIVEGAERFEEGGRNPIQARCVQLARMGCVVFSYDMIGYADSQQISSEVAHRFSKQRPEMNRPDGWGLFSPQAESHLESVMGLQAWNSIRALDWLEQLPDVDARRIAVTGASGGGTQTFVLCAIDPRPTVAVPAVMVSTAMQGGCTCENACLLRVGTGNVEFAALFAPRPLCLLSANDWTREMPEKGYPELEEHYAMLGARERLLHRAHLHFGHNYNYVSRHVMYHWLNRHLQLGRDEPIVEEDYRRLTGDQLTVWDGQHPQPPGGQDFEVQLLRWWTQDARRQIDALRPRDADSLAAYRDLIGPAVDIVIGRSLPAADAIDFETTAKVSRSGCFQITGLLSYRSDTEAREELPVVFLLPDGWQHGRVAIWLVPSGKQGLFDSQGNPVGPVQKMLDHGICVAGIDLLYQGEFLADAESITTTRRVGNPREAAAYTFGYNHALFAQRVHDVLSLITYVRHHERSPSEVILVGLNGAGPWAAAARAQAGQAVDRAVIDTQGFRFAAVRDIYDVNFLPGGAKYDDLPGMLALHPETNLWLAGETGDGLSLIRSAYQANGTPDNLQTCDPSADVVASAVAYLLEP